MKSNKSKITYNVKINIRRYKAKIAVVNIRINIANFLIKIAARVANQKINVIYKVE